MTPDFLRGFLQAGMLVTVASFILILTTKPNSAEFVISVCSLGIGLTLVGLIAVIIWLGKR
jgi:preprotein translocase subunit Sss1